MKDRSYLDVSIKFQRIISEMKLMFFVSAKAEFYETPDDGAVDIGGASAIYIPQSDVSWCNQWGALAQDDIDALDSLSQGAYNLGVATMRHIYEDHVLPWLGVTHMEIDPDYRGRGFGWKIMAELIAMFSDCNMLIAVEPGPIGDAEEGAVDKLIKYWREFGFRTIAESPAVKDHRDDGSVLIHHTTYRWPENSKAEKLLSEIKSGRR